MRKLEIDLDKKGLLFFGLCFSLAVIGFALCMCGVVLIILFLVRFLLAVSMGLPAETVLRLNGTYILNAGLRDILEGLIPWMLAWIIYRKKLSSHIKIEG